MLSTWFMWSGSVCMWAWQAPRLRWAGQLGPVSHRQQAEDIRRERERERGYSEKETGKLGWTIPLGQSEVLTKGSGSTDTMASRMEMAPTLQRRCVSGLFSWSVTAWATNGFPGSIHSVFNCNCSHPTFPNAVFVTFEWSQASCSPSFQSLRYAK